MTCPACGEAIPFAKVFFALNPIFTRCPTCHARLRGNGVMMAIGLAVCVVALAIAILGVYWIQRSVPEGALRYVAFGLFALGVGLALGMPMTKVAMRYGRYVPRDRAPDVFDDPPPPRGQARLALLVGVAGLLAGTVLGFVLAEGVGPMPATVERGGDERAGSGDPRAASPGAAPEEAAVLVPRPRTPERDEAPPIRAETRDAGTSMGPAIGAAVAFLEVTVTNAEGIACEAWAYALPEGVDTADWDWDDTLAAAASPASPARIGLPQAGTYDVVVRTHQPVGLARRRDVRVHTGETVRLRLAVPAGLPVTVVNEGTWPSAQELRAEGRPQLWLQTQWGSDLPWISASFPVPAEPGPWKTSPLPRDVRFQVAVGVTRPPEEPGKKHVPDTRTTFWAVETLDAEVEAGGTVRLRAVPSARAAFVCRPVDPETWPEGSIRFEVTLEHAGGRSRETVTWWGRPPKRPRTRYLSGVPGVASLRWEGTGIRPGSLAGIRLPQGGGMPHRLDIAVDPAAWPRAEPLVLRIAGVAPLTFGNLDTELSVQALLERDEGEPDLLEWYGAPASAVALNYGWRRAPHLVVRQGRFRVSRATRLPATGDVAIDLHPAGHLVVVPEGAAGAYGHAQLELSRSDGLPFFAGEAGVEPDLVLRLSPVQAGTLLGPLAPGPIAFDARLNGRPLPTARVVVEGGKALPLVLGK